MVVASPSVVGLIARTTSLTDWWLIRSSSSLIRKLSGSIPSSGEITPPRTWYLPLYTPERSIATRSLGSATTQIVSFVRDWSLQILQGSISVMLKQVEQYFNLSLAWTMAVNNRSIDLRELPRTKKASRWADLGPMPGSFWSSLIKLASDSAYMFFIISLFS